MKLFGIACCVFWPANRCSTCHWLVEMICFCIKTSFLWSEKMVKVFLASKNNFEQWTVCGAPVRWSEFTTIAFTIFKLSTILKFQTIFEKSSIFDKNLKQLFGWCKVKSITLLKVLPFFSLEDIKLQFFFIFKIFLN